MSSIPAAFGLDHKHPFRGYWVRLVRRVSRVHREHKVLLDSKVHKEHKVHKESKVLLGLLDLLVKTDQLVHKGSLGRKVSREQPGFKV
jgi:hypothetical protein